MKEALTPFHIAVQVRDIAEMVRAVASLAIFILAFGPAMGKGKQAALTLLAAILLIAAAANSQGTADQSTALCGVIFKPLCR